MRDLLTGKRGFESDNCSGAVSYTHLDVYKRQVLRLLEKMISERSRQ